MSFLVCSMTKAITASMIDMVIDEGKLDFSTQLYQIFPEYQRNDAQANITIEDLLSHRTGLASYDGLWLSSDNQILLNRSEAIPILNYSPSASALRTEFIYNNIAYEVLGQVLEKSTGSTYSELLRQVIVETVLGNEVDADTYLNTAITASKNTIESVNAVHKELLAGKTIDQPTRDITAYTGRYYNVIENFFIDIIEIDGRIQVAYMGSSNDTFDLIPYESDSFFWWFDFNESAKRARLPGYPKEYFILKFSCPSTSSWLRSRTDVEMGCLTWKHEFQLAGPREVFRKKTRNPYSEVFGTFGIFKELR
ncbi:hypothetical protein FP744_10009155 [Trichoderma asperellum]|nr:beta-lactamase/transpeptidase-like protein [Trichoderma asperelloides]